jgi:leucyl aminopeptidase
MDNRYDISTSNIHPANYDASYVFLNSTRNPLTESILNGKININPDIINVQGIYTLVKYNMKTICKTSRVIGKNIKNINKVIAIFCMDMIGNEIKQIMAGIINGIYIFDIYKTKKQIKPKLIFIIQEQYNNIISDYLNMLINQMEIRDLINMPLNKLNTIDFSRHIQHNLKDLCTVEILTQAELIQKGLNLIVAVNQASNIEAQMLIIRYNGGNKDDKPLCFAGKGVMFDTGGLNLKLNDMVEMKTDMAGGAIVYGLLKTASQQKIKKNIIGIIPLVHNEIGPNAIHPGDIVTAYNKMTVEITDTDAEGRLILADAISYSAKYNPYLIIDIATLTGQASKLYDGNSTIAITNNTDILKKLQKCGADENEMIIDKPEWIKYKDTSVSNVADIANYIQDAEAGDMIMGGVFISHFVPQNVDWIHLDIAAVSYINKDSDTLNNGATGTIFRSLANFIKN